MQVSTPWYPCRKHVTQIVGLWLCWTCYRPRGCTKLQVPFLCILVGSVMKYRWRKGSIVDASLHAMVSLYQVHDQYCNLGDSVMSTIFNFTKPNLCSSCILLRSKQLPLFMPQEDVFHLFQPLLHRKTHENDVFCVFCLRRFTMVSRISARSGRPGYRRTPKGIPDAK